MVLPLPPTFALTACRWSVEALADKFRVRPQRMLAALALKVREVRVCIV